MSQTSKINKWFFLYLIRRCHKENIQHLSEIYITRDNTMITDLSKLDMSDKLSKYMIKVEESRAGESRYSFPQSLVNPRRTSIVIKLSYSNWPI